MASTSTSAQAQQPLPSQREKTTKFRSEVRSHCSSFRREVEKLKKPLRTDAFKPVALNLMKTTEKLISEESAASNIPPSSLRAMVSQLFAIELDSLHLELLSRCNAFDTFSPAQREELWKSHLAYLVSISNPPPSNTATPNSPSFSLSISSTPPRSPSPHHPPQQISSSPPLSSVSPPITSSPTPQQQSTKIKLAFPTITAREEALLFVLSRLLIHPPLATAAVSASNLQTSPTVFSENVSQLWLLCGPMLLLSLRMHMKDKVIPSAWQAAGVEIVPEMKQSLDLLASGVSVEPIKGPSTPPKLIVELSAILHDAIATGTKITTENIIQHTLIHEHTDLVDLCKEIRFANDFVSLFFNSETRIPNPVIAAMSGLLSDDDVLGLWDLTILTRISECLIPPDRSNEAETETTKVNGYSEKEKSIGLLHDLLICWLFGCDPLLLAHFECYWVLFAMIDAGDVSFLWDAAVHVLEPNFNLSSKEGVLSLEENWRPFTLVRFKPEKPHGMHSRDYLMARVFSAMFRTSLQQDEDSSSPSSSQAQAQHNQQNQSQQIQQKNAYQSQQQLDKLQEGWSHWGKAFWHSSAHTLFTALDISETWSSENISAILEFLSKEKCTKLTHVNLQGTSITAHELSILPQSTQCIALSDCFLHDEDIDVLVKACPHLEVVILRNCDELTDVSVDTLLTLPSIHSLDLSGDVLISHKARVRIRERNIKLKFEAMTVEMNFKLTGEYRAVSQAFVDGIEKKLKQIDASFDIALANTPEKLRLLFTQDLFDRLVSQASASIGHPAMREATRARVLKKTLKNCMAAFTPLAMLVAESCGIPGLKLGSAAIDQIWHSIFVALPAAENEPKPVNKDETTTAAARPWKQHTLEYIISSMLSQQHHWKHLPSDLRLLWVLAREHIHSLKAESVIDGRVINKALHDLQSCGITLDELHISSEGVSTLPECPVAVKSVIIHGKPLSEATMKRACEMFISSGIRFSIVPCTIQTEKTKIDKEALAIAATFNSKTNQILIEGAIKSSGGDKIPADYIRKLFLEVKAFEEAIKAYLSKQNIQVNKMNESYEQFFCSCASWLDVPQLMLLEFTGVAFRLAQNQLEYVWRNAAASHNFCEPPHEIPIRDFTISNYVSRTLQSDPLDVYAAFVLQTCSSLQSLDLSQVDPLPLVEAEIKELTIGGGETLVSNLIIQSIHSKIKKPASLHSLHIKTIPDMTEDDIRTILAHFRALENLEIEDCSGISTALIDALKVEKPSLNIIVKVSDKKQ